MSLLRSGTYGLGSLRTPTASSLPAIGRCQYTKSERRARLAFLRDAFEKRGRQWWKTPRSVLQLIKLYPDAYQSEIKEVLKTMTETTSTLRLARFMHGNRSFYKAAT